MSRSEAWRTGLSEDQSRHLGVLWGKSDAGGCPNLLIQHLFDAMAVAGLMWDEYVAPAVKDRFDVVTEGDGRRLFRWLCGLHDIGKASPAFQDQAPHLAERVRAAGLATSGLSRRESQSWRHERAGAFTLMFRLADEWSARGRHRSWIWPLVAGHHGQFPSIDIISGLREHPRKLARLHGSDDAWQLAHTTLVDVVTRAAGYPDLASVEPVEMPSRADQLLLSGLIVMADWVSSDESHFTGIDDLDAAGIAIAEKRARKAWDVLGLREGWGDLPVPADDPIERRFGYPSRPSQTMVVDTARSMAAPGLLIVEAPMGEGKTEAALGAAEVLAARFGCDGVFVGLPTQATSDPMFSRVRTWLSTFEASPQVSLLHGKRRFNPEWHRLITNRSNRNDKPCAEHDEYGMAPEFGGIAEDGGDACHDGAEAASEWYQGPKRGLLSPNVVATIDQLLFAGTRTRHVMVRYAGLAGKVVILDEVHAADVYMSQFLGEALAWLGQGQVPVILLSATLSPAQRRHLMESYLAGARGTKAYHAPWAANIHGYPSTLAAWAHENEVAYEHAEAPAWKSSHRTTVEVVTEKPDDATSAVGDLLERDLAEGGCALVIRNTVGRAQDVYEELRRRFPTDEVTLLHGRFSAADRADKAADLLKKLGPDARDRPHRLITVATQIAEQSFDVDADLLVSDLAPVDLLLQRAGRLHRHDRPLGDRPQSLQASRIIVTGVGQSDLGAPWLPLGSEAIYGRYLLLQSLALVQESMPSGWSVPDDIPTLVERCYAEDVFGPQEWHDDMVAARQTWMNRERERASAAHGYLLAEPGQRTKPTLEGLHGAAVTARDVEACVRVRDGEMGVEVILVRRASGGYRSLRGRWLGTNGEAAVDEVDEVVGGAVRLPSTPRYRALAIAAERLGPLPEWADRKWLKHCHVLVLDEAGGAELAGWTIRYDPELGLAVEPA